MSRAPSDAPSPLTLTQTSARRARRHGSRATSTRVFVSRRATGEPSTCVQRGAVRLETVPQDDRLRRAGARRWRRACGIMSLVAAGGCDRGERIVRARVVTQRRRARGEGRPHQVDCCAFAGPHIQIGPPDEWTRAARRRNGSARCMGAWQSSAVRGSGLAPCQASLCARVGGGLVRRRPHRRWASRVAVRLRQWPHGPMRCLQCARGALCAPEAAVRMSEGALAPPSLRTLL